MREPTHPFMFNMSDTMYRRVKQAAFNQDTSMTDILRRFVDCGLSQMGLHGQQPQPQATSTMILPPPPQAQPQPAFKLPSIQGGEATPQELYNYRPKPHRVRQSGWDNFTWNVMREEWECEDRDEDMALKARATGTTRTYGGDDNE